MATVSADEVISSLNLAPHPEGGYFRETFRAAEQVDVRGGRSAATLIYFLLKRGELSAWHCVNGSSEHFLYHAGDAYLLQWVDENGSLIKTPVGADVAAGEMPQRTVPAGRWQSAFSDPNGLHGWSLVACLVSPGFDFADFELATDDEMAARYPTLAGELRLPR